MPFLPILAVLWGNPLSRLIIIGVAAFAFGWLKGFNAVPRVDIAALERNTIAARDAYWERQLAEANKAHDEKLAAALEDARAVPDTPAVPAERVRLCSGDRACRDNKGR